ncbi:MAG: hypothetical protein NT165_00600 [Candidatus Falkowbacteria bacterium]|nr:hypothetical protein [Candidatus Falkowbacteria bacterium]
MVIILGIVVAFGGVMMILKTEWLLENFGRIDWFEEKFGTEGGSRLGYKLLGLVAVIIGVIMMTGSSSSFMQWVTSPLTNAGIGGSSRGGSGQIQN